MSACERRLRTAHAQGKPIRIFACERKRDSGGFGFQVFNTGTRCMRRTSKRTLRTERGVCVCVCVCVCVKEEEEEEAHSSHSTTVCEAGAMHTGEQNAARVKGWSRVRSVRPRSGRMGGQWEFASSVATAQSTTVEK